VTEAEWLACTDPDSMIFHLHAKASNRKLRLYCCACVRRVWDQLASVESGHQAVQVAEAFADGQKTPQDLAASSLEVESAIRLTSVGKVRNALLAAGWCVSGSIDALGITRSVAWGAAYASRQAAAAERSAQVELLREMFGNPFRPVTLDPARRTPKALTLAREIYGERAFDRLPALADRLEQAGCTNPDIVRHCRSPGPHVRGCWVVDLLLGKE
jgi:hypothetical protein